MLTRILANQIGHLWEEFRETVRDSCGEVSEAEFSRLLEAMNKNLVQAWAFLGGEEEDTLKALVVTTPNKQRQLLIYAIKIYSHLEPEEWVAGLAVLKDFARAIKCEKIVGYQTPEEIARRKVLSQEAVERLGGRMRVIKMMEFDT